MTDERLLDGIKLTSDAHDAGKLEALRDFESMLEEFGQDVGRLDAESMLEALRHRVRERIAETESHREAGH